MGQLLTNLLDIGVKHTHLERVGIRIRFANQITAFLMLMGISSFFLEEGRQAFWLIVFCWSVYPWVFVLHYVGWHQTGRFWLGVCPSVCMAFALVVILPAGEQMPTGSWSFFMTACLLPWLLFDVEEKRYIWGLSSVLFVFPFFVSQTFGWIETDIVEVDMHAPTTIFILVAMSMATLLLLLILLQKLQEKALKKQADLTQELQKANDNLEQEVKKRTNELTEALKQVSASEEEAVQNLEELQLTQEHLEEQKDNLEQTLQELQETQTQLILAEKMASLGQLVANISHEINTPLGAIRSLIGSAKRTIGETFVALPTFTEQLSTEERAVLVHIAQELLTQTTQTFSSLEMRKLRKDLTNILSKKSIPEADKLADKLVDIGIYDTQQYDALWQSPHIQDLVQMLYQMASVLRSANNIQIAIDRASKTIFALKSYSRQAILDEKSFINPNESVEIVLTLYQNLLNRGVEVTRCFANLPELLCYPDELMQVWTNLIHNAIHAMEGKGNLTIETKERHNHIIVSIQDTGMGIMPEIQDKIFNAFFTTKKLGEGSGLGLDIVKKIIDKHAGKIWFETEVGKGTTFFVEIPLA